MEAVRKAVRKDWYIIIIIAAGLVLGLLLYARLPSRIVTHWNAEGMPDGYSSRLSGVLSLPLMNIALYILFTFLPHIDPKKSNYGKFAGSYQILKLLIASFMSVIQAAIMAFAVGLRFSMAALTCICVSLVFIIVGNMMGRFRFNYFVGIKTPWTLASEEVWRKTHRMAAPLWTAGGILIFILAFFPPKFTVAGIISIAILISAVPVVYSYAAYRKLGN